MFALRVAVSGVEFWAHGIFTSDSPTKIAIRDKTSVVMRQALSIPFGDPFRESSPVLATIIIWDTCSIKKWMPPPLLTFRGHGPHNDIGICCQTPQKFPTWLMDNLSLLAMTLLGAKPVHLLRSASDSHQDLGWDLLSIPVLCPPFLSPGPSARGMWQWVGGQFHSTFSVGLADLGGLIYQNLSNRGELATPPGKNIYH